MILATRKPILLFIILVIFPIVGHLLTTNLDIEYPNWYGISLLLWVRWIWEMNQLNNKSLTGNNSFDLTLMNWAYGLLTIFYVLFSFQIILRTSNSNPTILDVIFIIIHSACAFYLLWITARISELTLERREPTTMEIISYMINLTFFPLGIWTIHKPLYELRSASNRR